MRANAQCAALSVENQLMSEVDEFREWARSMSERARFRESKRNAEEMAELNAVMGEHGSTQIEAWTGARLKGFKPRRSSG